jgi:hypothetical protein
VRLAAPFRAAGEHIEIDLPGARALFTTRRGGVSEGPYESLNLGILTEDARERVVTNQELVAERVGGGASPAGCRSTAAGCARCASPRPRSRWRRPTARR